jgi:diguanylate cyclase (GGDEF)-like protein
VPTSSFALVVEPDRQAASELAGTLFTSGVECAVAESGDDAWHALATRRPDLVVLALGTPALERFHRRLRDEYLGQRPRLIGMASPELLEPGVAGLELDAVILRPLRGGALFASLAGRPGPLPVASVDVGRMREMLKLSCLGGELQSSLDALATRLALVYGVSRAVVIAAASERHWVGSTGARIPNEVWPELWDVCGQAVNAGAPLFVEQTATTAAGRAPRPARIETRLGVPIPGPSGAWLGAICLFSDNPQLFAGEARDALSALASRLGLELGWRSVHDRLSAERDRLRETSTLDPSTGILSRAALEAAIAAEITRLEHTRESLALAVLDISGLRQINDHYGHLAGDAAIKHMATVTRRLVRPHDVVGRSGGDEIAILFRPATVPAATTLLDRIRRGIEAESFSVEDSGPLYLRVGVGVTEPTARDEDVVALLERASRSAGAAGQRGGAIVIADRASPRAETKPNLTFDRYEVGVTLGGMYQIVHEISRGAMGVVYRAEDLGLSRPVAIKRLRPDLTRDTELVRRFREEAGILASINHENLVRVYSFVEDRDDVFFVMELVEGVSLDNLLADLIEENRDLDCGRVAVIVSQVASALDAMHDAGVTHRDVKPGNVVLDRTRDRAVLVDVGLARRLGDKSEPAGTPGYIAPESLRGDPESPATDVYGLAATTYALLTGQAPFGRADDYREILRRQIEEMPRPPSEWREDLPPGLDAVVLRGMSPEQNERFASAGEMALAFEAAIGDLAEIGEGFDTHPAVSPVKKRTEPGFAVPPPGDRPSSETGRRLLAGLTPPDRSPRGRDDSSRGVTPWASSTPRSDSRRSVTIEMAPGAELPPEPVTRGVVFRAVTRVLGLRATATWMRTVERNHPALGDALSLGTSPLAWLPAQLFRDLLDTIGDSGRNPVVFARELGSIVVEESFARFYPSSPGALSPETTLSALDILWRRYHSWGELRLERSDAHSALIAYLGSSDGAICGFIEGWLERVVSLSGGTDPRIAHRHGLPRCEFATTWR